MNLLLDDRPLVILPLLAKELGNLNEAVFLQQLHYWLDIKKQTGKNFVDGRYWVYNSLDEWLEQFSWMTKATLRRTIDSLVSKGYLLKGNFNQSKLNHTVWYSINYEKVMEIEKKSKAEREEQAKAALDKAENNDNSENPKSLVPQGTCRYAQNEHIDMLKSTNRCAQNEHIDMRKMSTSICSNWTHRCAQNEHINTIDYPKNNQETTSAETSNMRASPRPEEAEEVLRAYNKLCSSFPPASSLTPKREQAICALFDAGHDLQDIQRVFRRAEESDFLSGRSKDAAWDRFDFDWLIEPSHFANVLEGKYDNFSVRKQKRMAEGEALRERMLEKLRDESAGTGTGAEISLPFFQEAIERHRAFSGAGDTGSVQEAGP